MDPTTIRVTLAVSMAFYLAAFVLFLLKNIYGENKKSFFAGKNFPLAAYGVWGLGMAADM